MLKTPLAAAELCLRLPLTAFGESGDRPWTAESILDNGSVMLSGEIDYVVAVVAGSGKDTMVRPIRSKGGSPKVVS